MLVLVLLLLASAPSWAEDPRVNEVTSAAAALREFQAKGYRRQHADELPAACLRMVLAEVEEARSAEASNPVWTGALETFAWPCDAETTRASMARAFLEAAAAQETYIPYLVVAQLHERDPAMFANLPASLVSEADATFARRFPERYAQPASVRPLDDAATRLADLQRLHAVNEALARGDVLAAGRAAGQLGQPVAPRSPSTAGPIDLGDDDEVFVAPPDTPEPAAAPATPGPAATPAPAASATASNCTSDPAREAPTFTSAGDGDRYITVINTGSVELRVRLVNLQGAAVMAGTMQLPAGARGTFQVPAGGYRLRIRDEQTCTLQEGSELRIGSTTAGMQVAITAIFSVGERHVLTPTSGAL